MVRMIEILKYIKGKVKEIKSWLDDEIVRVNNKEEKIRMIKCINNWGLLL